MITCDDATFFTAGFIACLIFDEDRPRLPAIPHLPEVVLEMAILAINDELATGNRYLAALIAGRQAVNAADPYDQADELRIERIEWARLNVKECDAFAALRMVIATVKSDVLEGV